MTAWNYNSTWNASRDAILIEMRARGGFFHDIACALGIGKTAVMRRAGELGIHTVAHRRDRKPEPVSAEPKRDPLPLPAGHPIAWGIITAGTILAGEPYRREAA